jgi:CheY-like chemotaxis protein
LNVAKSGDRSLRRHKTVVVVAEHKPSRGVVSRLLKRMGYRVVAAANGIEAQQLAAGERRIDLLLAEFSALGTRGVELVRWFSANRPEIKVLVAADWLWEVESCLGYLPQVGVLANEFTPAELARMVRVILR